MRCALNKNEAQHRSEGEGQHERYEQREHDRQGQRREELALHTDQRQQRNERERNDQLPEEAWLPHFEHGLPYDFEPPVNGSSSCICHALEVTLDVFHLDNCGIHDHAERDGESAE